MQQIYRYQADILRSTQDVIVAVCGRGAGKTYTGALWLLQKLLQPAGFARSICVCSPTYKQSQIAGSYLVSLLQQHQIPYHYNTRPARGRYLNYANLITSFVGGHETNIHICSLDRPEHLRGFSWSDIYLDEAAFVDESTFGEVLLPAKRGYPIGYRSQVLITTSPAGKNWIYHRFFKHPSRAVATIQVPSTENFLTMRTDLIEQLKAHLSERVYRQEILAEFLDADLNAVFYAFAREHVKELQLPKADVYVSLDQNVSPGAGILATKINNEIYVFDEISIEEGARVHQYAAEILRKTHTAHLILCGDRSGNHRQLTSDSFYVELIKLLQQNGKRVLDRTLRKNPPIFASAELVNAHFEQRRLYISPRCQHLINDMQNARYGAHLDIDKSIHDPHWADALRYLVWSLSHQQIQALEKLF